MVAPTAIVVSKIISVAAPCATKKRVKIKSSLFIFSLFDFSVQEHAVVVKRLAGAGPEAVEEVLNGHALTLGA